MARRRFGVALLMPDPISAAIDALRGALGDQQVSRIPPHITLVPPVNVRAEDVDEVIEVLRSAAKATRPFPIRLGPPATFLPATPVLYLDVRGDVDTLHELRNRVFTRPLERPLTWPFVPHCTLLDDAEPERIRAATTALADARFDFHATDVHLLEEQAARRWQPIGTFPFRR